jgi:hypothetical protein
VANAASRRVVSGQAFFIFATINHMLWRCIEAGCGDSQCRDAFVEAINDYCSFVNDNLLKPPPEAIDALIELFIIFTSRGLRRFPVVRQLKHPPGTPAGGKLLNLLTLRFD